MANTIDDRLAELGIELPAAAPPAANYVPYLISGKTLFVSGQLPLIPGGEKFEGAVGADIDTGTAQRAARACGINILAQVKAALGDLGRIESCLKLGGYVNAAPGYTEHPEVVNGASNLMFDVLGDKGRHTRIAIGCSSLPRGVPVEIDAMFAVS